jgi:hypothetical protein
MGPEGELRVKVAEESESPAIASLDRQATGQDGLNPYSVRFALPENNRELDAWALSLEQPPAEVGLNECSPAIPSRTVKFNELIRAAWAKIAGLFRDLFKN